MAICGLLSKLYAFGGLSGATAEARRSRSASAISTALRAQVLVFASTGDLV
jgi:hypothetical protein